MALIRKPSPQAVGESFDLRHPASLCRSPNHRPGGTRMALDAVGSKPQPEPEVGGIAADRLRSIVERIERLEEERRALAADIKDIYAEAKSAGFDAKVLRALIRLRRQEKAEVEEQESLLDLYRRALGM
jgi:uncharacterized protein (UPF0335 family)